MGNELVAKQEQALMTAQDMEIWGVPQQVSAQDMVIPKILAMQGLSVLVTERKAQMGEFRDSLSGELLGSIDKPVEILPFYLQKVWDVLEEELDNKGKPSGKFKWARTKPLIENPAHPDYNDNLPWEGEENGVKIKNIRRFNFFCLIPSQVAEGSAMPYVLSFKSTSLKEGKKLYTTMYVRNIKAGLPPAAFTFNLAGIIDKNDQGSYVVPQVSSARKSTPEELKECLSWIKMINKGAVKIDESELTDVKDVSDDTGDY